MTTLTLPPYCPITLGPTNNGRKITFLAYTCQRMADGLFLNAKTSTWQVAPVLNAMTERGRTSTGATDPVFGALRGSYIQADTIQFANPTDAVGQYIIIYHNKSVDNFIVGSTVYQNGLQLKGQLNISITPPAVPPTSPLSKIPHGPHRATLPSPVQTKSILDSPPKPKS